jgi:gliding motility-associated-like protein
MLNKKKYIKCGLALQIFFVCFLLFINIESNLAQTEIDFPQTRHFFIENKGQWPKQVKFLARLGGMNCWITDSGVVYDYYRIDRNYSMDSIIRLLPHEKDEFERTHTSCKGQVVRMDYEGINLNAEKQGTDKSEAYYNYFIGNDSTKWASYVGLYGELIVKDAYFGIDIRYYFDSGQIRYDYLVKPGADIASISFSLIGADDVTVNEPGELIIQTSLGEVKHGRLFAYQKIGKEKREVICRFVRKEDGNFGIIASSYEKGSILVIDPLVWSTFLGGMENDFVYSFTLDKNSNVSFTGFTNSATYPTTTGVYDNTQNGNEDIIVTKLNSNASSLIYSTFIGGNRQENGISLDADLSDNLVLTGLTYSTNFPTTLNAFDRTFNSPAFGGSDIIVVKINSNGTSLIFSTYLGGSSSDGGYSVLLDDKGNSYISGATKSTNFPTTNGALQRTFSGGNDDAIISKFDPTGSLLAYSTYLGGAKDDLGNAIVIDNSYNIIVSGVTSSLDFPTTSGVYDQIYNGDNDGFISKIDSIGSSLIFSTFIGGSNGEWARTIALDNSMNIYISGETWSTDYPITLNAYDRTHDSLNDIVISKFNPTCTKLESSTYLGGRWSDCAFSIALDIDNNIYITGNTASSNYPVTSDALFRYLNGINDVIISVINSDLSKLIYSTYLGGSNIEDSWCIKVDSNRIAYILGMTQSADFPVTPGVIDNKYDSLWDIFLSKIDMINTKYKLVYKNIDCSSLGLSWNKMNGGKYVVFMREGNNGIPKPVNNRTYFADTVFGLGSEIDNTGWYCVYNDTNNYVTIHGLKANTTYRSMVLEYFRNKGSEIYINDTSQNNPSNHITFPQPVAMFLVNDTIQCLKGNNYNFTSTSSYPSGSLSNQWWFGDGDSSRQQNPFHTYKNHGTYNVKLITSIGKDCLDSITKKIHVIPSPTASFSINDSSQCLGDNSFIFINNSSTTVGNIMSKWHFGDGDSSIISSPTHRYANADTFKVRLIVVSDTGCQDTLINFAKVYINPNANFIAYDSSQCFERNNFAFTNNSFSKYGTYNCLWDFGDSAKSTQLNPMHKYSYADTFTVQLIVKDTFGCEDTLRKHTWVHVHPEPTADFVINDSSQCLNGNIFVLSNSSTIKSGTFSQKWDFADGYDTNSFDASHSYNYSDTFLLKLLVISDWACKDSILKKTYVHQMPSSGFSINTNPQNLPGNYFVFTSTSTIPSGNIKYRWDFGDGDTSALSNPSHSYTAAGSFNVILITISDYGCADTFTDSVLVKSDPGIIISFNTTNACYGEEVLFTNTSTVVPPDSFLNFFWDFGDGNQAIVWDDPKHVYTSAGTYYVTLVVITAYGFKDTLIDTLEIYPTPTVDLTAVPDTISLLGKQITLTANGSYDQLLWSDNSTSNSITVSIEGKYWVMATYNNGCKSSDTIEIIKGEIKDIEVMNVITPNGDGYNDRLVIKNIDQIQPCKLLIYNRWGNELYSSSNYQNDWDGIFKGQSLPEGTYYYVLETRDGKVYKGAVNILK